MNVAFKIEFTVRATDTQLNMIFIQLLFAFVAMVSAGRVMVRSNVPSLVHKLFVFFSPYDKYVICHLTVE